MFHFVSSEFTALLVFLGMVCFTVLYAIPTLDWTTIQLAFYVLSWAVAQRSVATGGRYTPPQGIYLLGANHREPLSSGAENKQGADADDGPLIGKVAIVTGSTSGIGFETAKELVRLGATVVFGCRNEAKAKQTMQQIQQNVLVNGQGLTEHEAKGRLIFLTPLDLEDFHSVVRFAKGFEEWAKRNKSSSVPVPTVGSSSTGSSLQRPSLHLLVNNAGQLNPSLGLTKTGHERHVAANYLGPLLLTELLLPCLMATPNSRIVNVASSAHNRVSKRSAAGLFRQQPKAKSSSNSSSTGTTPSSPVGPFTHPRKMLQTLTCSSGAGGVTKEGTSSTAAAAAAVSSFEGRMKREYPIPVTIYGLSKLMIIYMTNEHSKMLRDRCGPNCVATALHPGIIYSALFHRIIPTRYVPGLSTVVKMLSLLGAKTEWEGAQTTLHCATTTDIMANGYYIDCKDYGRGSGVSALSEAAEDPEASKQCYEWGLEQIGPWLRSG